jgi:hypothetical protein
MSLLGGGKKRRADTCQKATYAKWSEMRGNLEKEEEGTAGS